MENFKLTLGKNGIKPKLRIGDDQNKFQIVVDTRITGGTGSNSNTFVLPTVGAGYNALVEWGDGSSQRITGTPGNVTKIYSRPGIYTVKIGGLFPRIYFGIGGDCLKLKEIKNWGNNVWSSMQSAFKGCENMIGTYTDIPNTYSVTNMNYMFGSCRLFNSPVNFDTSNVTDMGYMFYVCNSFNQPVNFNTSKVTYMAVMFYQATVFNQPLNWNTSSLENTSLMFPNANNFNQDISQWDITKLTTANNMFLATLLFSTTNYDKILDSTTGWASQSVQNSVVFGGPPCKYTKAPSNAATGRAHLTDSIGSGGHGWTITDGGPTP